MNSTTNEFLASADSRKTSIEIMQAIIEIAGEERAPLVWDEPTAEEALAIWEIVTLNGLRDSEDYFWGEAGVNWGKTLGVEQVE
jgi:hypothetical protein